MRRTSAPHPRASLTALAVVAALPLARPAWADNNGEAPVRPRVWWTGAMPTVPGLPPGLLGSPANWSAPLRADDELGFSGAGPSLLINNITGLSVRSLSFDGGRAYTLDGQPIRVTGGIVNHGSARQTLNTVLQAGATGSQTWSGGEGGLTFRLAGALSQQLRLLYGDATVVGPLQLQRSSTGSGDSATVRLTLASSTLHTPDGAEITGGSAPAAMILYDSHWRSGGVVTVAGPATSISLDRSDWQASTLALRGSPRLTLQRSQLTVDRLIGSGGVDWISGVITVNGDLQLGAIAPTVTLDHDRQLYVGGVLTIGPGERAIMTGKSLLQAPELRLAGGVLQANAPLGGALPRLTGHGQWLGRASGSLAIEAHGGRLRIGDAGQRHAVDLQGPVSVASGAVLQLDSADPAGLGARTNLHRDAELYAPQGMVLGADEVLSIDGHAVVRGTLVNDGSLVARAGRLQLGRVELQGQLSGQGSFSGELDLRGELSPGADVGLGLGQLNFSGDSRLLMSEGSVLTLDITRQGEQWAGDTLGNLGVLQAAGELRLRFHDVDAQAAGQWQALRPLAASGQFNRVTVQGLAPWRVDTSQLLSSGRLQVSAVPEPGAAALLLLGLAVLCWRHKAAAGPARQRRARPAGPQLVNAAIEPADERRSS